MKHRGDYGRALAKIKQYDGSTWAGYLTYQEILALIDKSVQGPTYTEFERAKDGSLYRTAPKTQTHHPKTLAYYRDKLKLGQVGSTWFYFTPTDEVLRDKEMLK